MTLDEVISILSLAAHGHAFTIGPDFYKALQVGIEAVKRHQQISAPSSGYIVEPLPGETEE